MTMPMRIELGFGCFLAAAVVFVACGSDDEKRQSRDDDGGAAGEVTGAGGSSLNAAGAAEGGTGLVGDGGAAPGPGGTGNGQAGEASTGTPLTVTGLVVAFNDQPLAGVVLEVQGKTLTTADDGTFEVDVLSPYDIVLRNVDSTSVEAFLDVTRADPKLRVNAGPDRSASLQGTVSGGAGFPQPANHETEITYRGGQLVTFSDKLPASSNGAFSSSFPVGWLTQPTLTGSLVAVQRNLTTGDVTGFGTAPVTLTADELLTGADIAMVTPVLRDFDVTLSSPIAISQFSVFVGPLSLSTQIPADEFSVQIPSGIPDDVGIVVNAYGVVDDEVASAVLQLPGDAAGVELSFSDVPLVTAPALEVASLPANARFEYVSPAAEMTTLGFDYTTVELGGELQVDHSVRVHTDADSVALSRLLALGLDVSPPGETVTWVVSTRRDVESVDAFLAPSFPPGHAQISLTSGRRQYGGNFEP